MTFRLRLVAHLHPFTAFFCCLGILAGASLGVGEQSQGGLLARILKAEDSIAGGVARAQRVGGRDWVLRAAESSGA